MMRDDTRAKTHTRRTNLYEIQKKKKNTQSTANCVGYLIVIVTICDMQDPLNKVNEKCMRFFSFCLSQLVIYLSCVSAFLQNKIVASIRLQLEVIRNNDDERRNALCRCEASAIIAREVINMLLYLRSYQRAYRRHHSVFIIVVVNKTCHCFASCIHYDNCDNNVISNVFFLALKRGGKKN